MGESNAIYIGLDVHKDTIAVAVAWPGRGDPEYRGVIANDSAAIRKLLKRLEALGVELNFCYEAGPCGYGLCRMLTGRGHDCEVVAPSLIPRKVGDRMKTDRRDALQLARLHRAGELTAVWVPDEAQESLRDVTRAREDMVVMARQARQRLNAFLLRHGHVYRAGKSRWTQQHFRWLSELRFSSPLQQSVFEEYMTAVKAGLHRVAALDERLREVVQESVMRPVVEALMALRGVSLVTALTVVAELGDISRFESPKQLMGYLGLVPSEHSSGPTRRQGGITRTGNGHVRRVLVEAAWNYRFMARRSRVIEARASKTPERIQAIAWEGQKRLCGRYRQLMEMGKQKNQVTVAVARELSGFIWAIACEVTGKPHSSKVLA